MVATPWRKAGLIDFPLTLTYTKKVPKLTTREGEVHVNTSSCKAISAMADE